MATIFLLGPGEWDPARGGSGAKTPLRVRRELAAVFWRHGHHVLIMEDEKDLDGEDLVAKFERLLKAATDLVLYWPPRAKMAATFDEMLLLRKAAESGRLPRLWFVHHEAVARIERGVFAVLESGGRSRYLTALARLGITPVPWAAERDLRERVALLAAEIP